LAWTVLLAPQVRLVHALSHSLPGSGSERGEGDARKHAPSRVCDTCLALAQLGATMTSTFHHVLVEASAPSHDGPAPIPAMALPTRGYDARAPPATLS
jgi:hypothetical protein